MEGTCYYGKRGKRRVIGYLVAGEDGWLRYERHAGNVFLDEYLFVNSEGSVWRTEDGFNFTLEDCTTTSSGRPGVVPELIAGGI